MSRDRAEQSDRERRPQPPILSWLEQRRGARGQLPLPGTEDDFSFAEVAFVGLVERWIRALRAPADRSDAELMGLSALLFAEEASLDWTRSIALALDEAFEAVETEKAESYRALVWRLVYDRLDPWGESYRAAETLLENLDHHRSGMRGSLLRLAWVVRRRLPREQALGRVCAALESGSSDLALGLGVAIAGSIEEFQEVAKAHRPDAAHLGVYQGALARLASSSAVELQSEFWRLEAISRAAHLEVLLELSALMQRPSSTRESIPPSESRLGQSGTPS